MTVACNACGSTERSTSAARLAEWHGQHRCDPGLILAAIDRAWTCACDDKGYRRLKPNERCSVCGAMRVLRRKDFGHLEYTVPSLVAMFEGMRSDLGTLVEFSANAVPKLREHGNEIGRAHV